MIRIDEIYNSVFLPLVQHKKDVALHWFDPFGSVKIEHMVNLPPVDNVAQQRIVFWDQEPLHRDLFEIFMDQFQKTYFGPVLLITSEKNSDAVYWAQDTYGLAHGYYFFHGWAALDWYRGYNHSFLWQQWNAREFTNKIFCPNNIISGERKHRVRLISGMDQRGLLADNLISFPSHCPFSQDSADSLCHDLGVPSIQNLPLLIDHANNHANNSHKIDFHNYAVKCFCHVVTETLFYGKRLHLTEKTFKPIVLQQPFVLMATQGSLAYLRSYGFQTFECIWDETYDLCEDGDRIDAILDLLNQINSWTPGQIRDAQTAVAGVVQHNHDWFYGGFQDLLWKELCDMIDLWS